jgi:Na+-transporting NADH:ubiquinone oxidoreductase subunit NqrD
VSAVSFGLNKQDRAVLFDPVILNNPIGVQVLGICSARHW